MRLIRAALVISILAMAEAAFATIFGSIRGFHDPQHRSLQRSTRYAEGSELGLESVPRLRRWGGFEFGSVPIGNYTVTVSSKVFQTP